jgi:hypothetical protein
MMVFPQQSWWFIALYCHTFVIVIVNVIHHYYNMRMFGIIIVKCYFPQHLGLFQIYLTLAIIAVINFDTDMTQG